MRARHRGYLILLVLLAGMPLRGDEWEELRNRPGNDDIYVMVDTSSSMAPSAGGSLGGVKGFLQDLFARYVKQGDRIIVMTFDADARVHGIMPIAERRRDVELLRDVIDGIDVRRVIHYSGTWPDLEETRDGPWAGGGAATDYCEMWRLSARIIRQYGDPSHRQWFLLFADGLPDAPAYRPCNDSGVMGALSPELREGRLRMGVVALPSASTPVGELSRHLRELLQRFPVKIIEFRADGRRIDGPRREMLELLNARVDLAQPHALTLGARPVIDLRMPLTVINRSAVEKTVVIRNATLRLRNGAALPIPVTPSVITLPPRQTATFTLARADLFENPGHYEGELVFDFGRGARFDPPALAFSATKRTWLQAYRESVAWTAAGLAIILALATGWFRGRGP